MQVFAEPLKLRLTVAEHQAIFCNIHELLPLSESILAMLEQQQQQEHYIISRIGVRPFQKGLSHQAAAPPPWNRR